MLFRAAGSSRILIALGVSLCAAVLDLAPNSILVPQLVQSAKAQEGAPQACGRTDATADFGSVDVGTTVVLGRHRYVDGQDNWDEPMRRYIGRVARVTAKSGVDPQGCAGIRVDVDGGQFFWRLRDANLGTGPQPLPDEVAVADSSATAIPQDCRNVPNYGPVSVGTEVLLGRHRPLRGGDDNWAPPMSEFLGRRARVQRLLGPDGDGCPGVAIDIDGGQWFWRLRDLRMGTGQTSSARGPSQGVTTDHNRAAVAVQASSTSIFGTGGGFGPQACGLTDETVPWGDIRVGGEVIVGHHRQVEGQDNWDVGMDPYVGRQGRITQLLGVDDQGCGVVRIDLDGGQFFWRARDMSLPSAQGPNVTGSSLLLAPGFTPDPLVVTGQLGGPQDASQMDPTCRGMISQTPNYVLTTQGSFGALRIMAAAPTDATLVVQRPDGSFMCSDDFEGLNPLVEGSFPPGTYRIWVGSYGTEGVGRPFRLGISTRSSTVPSTLGIPGGSSSTPGPLEGQPPSRGPFDPFAPRAPH